MHCVSAPESTTSILDSQRLDASPATQKRPPRRLLSHSWISPVLAQRGSDSGRSVSRYMFNVMSQGSSTFENGGTVTSDSATGVRISIGVNNFVVSDNVSTYVYIKFNICRIEGGAAQGLPESRASPMRSYVTEKKTSK